MNENMPVNDLSSSQKGISNTTIAVLIVLALVITIIGTLAVLDSTSSNVSTQRITTNVGKVSLQILPLNDTSFNEPVAENTSS
jgi:hypothetical protein